MNKKLFLIPFIFLLTACTSSYKYDYEILEDEYEALKDKYENLYNCVEDQISYDTYEDLVDIEYYCL